MDNQEKSMAPLFQVWAIETKTGNMVAVPMFPRAGVEAANHFVETMQAMISSGKEKRYADPKAIEHLGYLASSPQ